MENALLDQVLSEWSARRPLEAGRLVYEHLRPQERPGWAGTALALVRPYFPAVPEIDAVLELARCPSRWVEGHDTFRAVRGLTLQAEREAGPSLPDPLHYTFLMLAENTAKVIYNASGSLYPFDQHCGWHVASSLYRIAELLGDPELLKKAWDVVSRGATCSHWSYVRDQMGMTEGAILGAPDARDPYGATALMYAAHIGCTAIIRVLLAYGAEINARDEQGSTPLMYAVEPGDPLLIHLLADAGAEVNAQTRDGQTALMFAAVHGIPAVAEALVQRGADVHDRDQRGETALSRVQQLHPEIAHLLKING